MIILKIMTKTINLKQVRYCFTGNYDKPVWSVSEKYQPDDYKTLTKLFKKIEKADITYNPIRMKSHNGQKYISLNSERTSLVKLQEKTDYSMSLRAEIYTHHDKRRFVNLRIVAIKPIERDYEPMDIDSDSDSEPLEYE